MTLGDGSTRINGKVIFFKIGLWHETLIDVDKPVNIFTSINSYMGRMKHWNVYALETIYEKLFQHSKPIDVLKIDVEGAEVLALEKSLNSGFLQKNVKQITLEWHLWRVSMWNNREALRKLLEIYLKLFEFGFKLFYHGNNGDRAAQLGVFPLTSFINTNLYNQLE